MDTSHHNGPSGLEEFVQECTNSLFSRAPYHFIYPKNCSLENWPIDEIKQLNNMFLKSLRGRANIYALHIRQPDQQWHPLYVGERKSIGLRERLTQHLINKDSRTGSMLAAVKTAVSSGEEIGITLIKVNPEPLRLYVEETIISKQKIKLAWNTHG